MSTTPILTAPKRSRGLHVSLWLVQFGLALFYGGVGFMKITKPIPDLAAMMQWPAVMPEALVRFIGAAELTGAIGLILPSLLRIAPRLSSTAAIGLVLIQALAIPFHISRGESSVLPLNVVLLALAAFIAWGRWRKAAILSR